MNLREDTPMFYMAWAKLSAASRFNLSTSGVMDYPLAELPARIEDLEINGPGRYGYPPLQAALDKKTGASAENILASIGTSMANVIAFSALIERGDEVLIEHPTYQPMLDIVTWLGANVRRFERPAGKGLRLELDELARQIRPTTKLIVLANLHNPSSVFIEEYHILRVGELVNSVGVHFLVDEFYLETVFD